MIEKLIERIIRTLNDYVGMCEGTVELTNSLYTIRCLVKTHHKRAKIENLEKLKDWIENVKVKDVELYINVVLYDKVIKLLNYIPIIRWIW